jgi:DNA-binding response OmpR family regulator
MDVFMVEDNLEAIANVRGVLARKSLTLQPFESPHEFFYALKQESPKMVILDWLLPEMTGLDVLKRFRTQMGKKIPVMMYTNKEEANSVVDALEAGADDFVPKLAPDNVLLARVCSLLRRVTDIAQPQQTLRLDPLELYFSAQEAFVAGEKIRLTPREFDVAWVLLSNPGRLFQKAELAAAVWGKQADMTFHTLSQHIYEIKKKLNLVSHGYKLMSVYGSGYRFETPSAA